VGTPGSGGKFSTPFKHGGVTDEWLQQNLVISLAGSRHTSFLIDCTFTKPFFNYFYKLRRRLLATGIAYSCGYNDRGQLGVGYFLFFSFLFFSFSSSWKSILLTFLLLSDRSEPVTTVLWQGNYTQILASAFHVHILIENQPQNAYAFGLGS